VEAGVDLTRREHNEDVGGIGVHGGDQTPGPLHASLFEVGIIRGLTEHGEIALRQTFLDLLGIVVYSHERHAVTGELAGDLVSDPAETAEYVMPV